MTGLDLWDTLSVDYDRFVNWEERLTRELPFLEALLSEFGVRTVLDVACGTGRHAIALAQRGYAVAGADVSQEMISRARENAKEARVEVDFAVAGFGALRQAMARQYDALLCLGNSLPSLLSEQALVDALEDMAQVLHPGGLMVIQDLNYDRVWPRRERFMPLQTYQQGHEEWLFFRFLDFHEETLTFNMVVLHRNGGMWDYHAGATELRPVFSDDLLQLLQQSGLSGVDCYGDYDQHPYHQETSGDLIVAATKSKA